jgi:hypothetical protein
MVRLRPSRTNAKLLNSTEGAYLSNMSTLENDKQLRGWAEPDFRAT